MPHISENEVEKMKNLKDKIKWLWQYGVERPTAREYFQAVVDAIQPAPQSDEVREAINWLSGYVESCKRDPQDRGERPEIKHIETLIRAAQFAPVDLERVREIINDEIYTSHFTQYDDEFTKGIKYGLEKALALLPTPSKE